MCERLLRRAPNLPRNSVAAERTNIPRRVFGLRPVACGAAGRSGAAAAIAPCPRGRRAEAVAEVTDRRRKFPRGLKGLKPDRVATAGLA